VAAARLAVALVGLALAAGLGLAARSMRPRAPLPVYGHVPTFGLLDQRGAPYATGAMLGHVTVADFVFTRCTASCPRLTARMGELQARLARRGSDTRLVSFSVDPDNDTPAVLADYAARAHADPARWTFVTGNADEMVRAVVLGFKVSAAKIEHGANDSEVTHGNWFVLADRSGALRGYYSTEESADLDKLDGDVERLEREKP
jgi:protein SCO1/2